MLTDQERMNNAFKELLFQEEQLAKKYADITQQITEPKIQSMLQGMEQASRNHYGTLSQKMGSLGIV
jgi:hypothetical protein